MCVCERGRECVCVWGGGGGGGVTCVELSVLLCMFWCFVCVHVDLYVIKCAYLCKTNRERVCLACMELSVLFCMFRNCCCYLFLSNLHVACVRTVFETNIKYANIATPEIFSQWTFLLSLSCLMWVFTQWVYRLGELLSGELLCVSNVKHIPATQCLHTSLPHDLSEVTPHYKQTCSTWFKTGHKSLLILHKKN